VRGTGFVQRLQTLSGEMETGRLDRILMRDDHHVTMRVLKVESSGDSGHPAGHVAGLLGYEVESRGVIQIGLELTGKPFRDGVPWVALPALCQLPIGEIGINPHGHRGTGGDFLSRAQRPLLRGRPDGHDRAGSQVATYPAGLFEAMWGQIETRHRATDEMVRVVHFGVSY
jgi:hypothetical protein